MALGACYVAKFDYEQVRRDADSLIDEFGDSGSFTRVTPGTIDQATGEQSPGTTTLINGAITPILRYMNNEVNGESVLRTDGYVYFSGGEIEVNDTTVLNGETLRVVDVTKLKSVGGTLVYQKVQLRR